MMCAAVAGVCYVVCDEYAVSAETADDVGSDGSTVSDG